MYRYPRYSDYYPTPLKYQYRFFYPPPVLPATQGIAIPRVHTCGIHAHDHGCNLWNRIGANYSVPGAEITSVRDHALKKILPWRVTPARDILNDTSFYTGKGTTYRAGSVTDIYDLPTVEKFPDLVKASNICAAHAKRSYTLPGVKVSPDEWRINNHQLTSGAEYAHNTCTMVKAEARGCIEEAEKEQVRRLTDTNKDLDDRLRDIDTWINNERDELRFNINQTHELLELKERLEVMLKNIETPLEIAQENMLTRESRQGAELVHDSVEESLLKEIETLRRDEEKLIGERDRMNNQLTRLRAARHEIEMDIRNKDDARKTDECAKVLSKMSNEIGGLDVPEGLMTTSSPTTWIQNSQSLIQRSQEERNTSQILYTEVSRTMIGCADESFNVWYETNASFTTRISEITSAKQQLEKQLQKIKNDIESLNRHINNVRKALDEKLPLLKLAQARLDKRKQRPGIELCRDKAMMTLYKEIYALKQAIDVLNAKLQELEAAMAQLMRTKGALEHDIKMKEVALFVDREKCLSLRQNFPISTFKETRYPKRIGSNGLPESRILR